MPSSPQRGLREGSIDFLFRYTPFLEECLALNPAITIRSMIGFPLDAKHCATQDRILKNELVDAWSRSCGYRMPMYGGMASPRAIMVIMPTL